jgi:hypothetical protein
MYAGKRQTMTAAEFYILMKNLFEVNEKDATKLFRYGNSGCNSGNNAKTIKNNSGGDISNRNISFSKYFIIYANIMF